MAFNKLSKKTGAAGGKKNFKEYAAGKGWGEGGGGFEDLPDGSYVGLLEKGEVKVNSKDCFMATITTKILEAEDEELVGRKHFNNLNFETEKGGWNPWPVSDFLDGFGLEMPEVEECEDVLQELAEAGTVYTFDLITKGTYQNLVVTGVSDEPYEEGEGTAAGDGDDGDGDPDGDESETLPSADEVVSWDKDECKEFIEVYEIECKTKILSKMREAIIAWLEEQEEGGDEGDPESDPEGGDEDPAFEALKEIADASGIDYADAEDLEALVAIMSEYEYPSKDLDEADLEVLASSGLGDCIVYPPPKKAAPKKAPAKKAAVKAPAKKAAAKKR